MAQAMTRVLCLTGQVTVPTPLRPVAAALTNESFCSKPANSFGHSP